MNLEQQKKQARELLRAIRSGNPDALERLRRHHPEWATRDEASVRQTAALHDTQFVLAREQGFASWPKLKAHAEPTPRPRLSRLFVPDAGFLEDRAQGLLHVRTSGVPAALEQIRDWHPRFRDSDDAEIMAAEFGIDDARLVYAREHGFETWEDLCERARVLAEQPDQEPFMAAFLLLKAQDLPALEELLRAHPDLARARGTNGNTLLNLAGSTSKSLEPVELLLKAGADVHEPNDRGWTPLHQAGYSNQPALADLLIAHGASIEAEAHGAGGTPLAAALFWGHREVSAVLAAAGVVPPNLRVAAGLGRKDLVEACFESSGTLTPAASSARGFYRPHSGFPDWTPSNDPQEVLDEALVWACKSDRASILPLLIAVGAQIDADPYRGTPLIWAAARNSLQAARWLLENGAEVNRRATFGGLSHGQGVTALHIAAQSGHREMVELLLNAGADPGIQDELYQGQAAGWANNGGHLELAEYLRKRAA